MPELASMLSYDEFAVRTMALAGTPWGPQSREWGEVEGNGHAQRYRIFGSR